MLNHKLLLIALTGFAGFAHAGDLYRWTDAQGVMHFSDTPPPQSTNPAQVKVERNKIGENEGTLNAPPKLERAQNAPTAPAQQRAPALADSHNRICDQARSNVELLQGKYQVADATGKVLDDKARADMLESAKRTADTCR